MGSPGAALLPAEREYAGTAVMRKCGGVISANATRDQLIAKGLSPEAAEELLLFAQYLKYREPGQRFQDFRGTFPQPNADDAVFEPRP